MNVAKHARATSVTVRRSGDRLTVPVQDDGVGGATLVEGSGIAARLVATDGAVEKHVSSIFTKVRLRSTEQDHRRVLAVLTYLDGR